MCAPSSPKSPAQFIPARSVSSGSILGAGFLKYLFGLELLYDQLLLVSQDRPKK